MVIAFFIGIIGVVNINISTNNRGLAEMVLANVEALANRENDGDEWSEEKFTEEEIYVICKENGIPVWQKIEVNCYEGGIMSSCEESCAMQLYYNGQWHGWTGCYY